MKKENKKILGCIIFIVAIVIFLIFVPLIIVIHNNQENTIYIGGKCVVFKGNLSKETQEECKRDIEKVLEFIPQKLVEEYNKPIYVYDDKNFKRAHKKTGSKNKASAFLGYDDKGEYIGIYINATKMKTETYGLLSILCHEFGHYFDDITKNLSSSEEWVDITKEEAQKMKRQNPYYEQPKEFFAEAFAWYCVSKGTSTEYHRMVACHQALDYISYAIKEYEQE